MLTSAFARADARLRLAASLWGELYGLGDRARVMRFLMLVARGTPSLEALSDEQRDAAAQSAARFVPDGTPAQTALVERIDVRADLAGICVPTLVIVTADDPLVAPALQRDLAAGIARAQVAELPIGHLAFAEDPAAWGQLITSFLTTAGGAA